MISSRLEQFTVPGDVLRVGVISDTQLPTTPGHLKKSDIYVKNLEHALTVLKNHGVGLILFAGDIGDLGTRFAFHTYMRTIKKIFGSQRPIIQTIMGNHDYWSKSFLTWNPHRRDFERIVGVPAWTHYVVNGYHFIGASPDNGSMTDGYRKVLPWLEREIAAAERDTPDRPIFVMTHNQPVNTSYGAEDWGDIGLGDVFERHPNVVNFSGHVHYSLLDERSIWQGKYTVINTQSLSYTELEPGKENGTIPPNAELTPMGYILDFEAQAIRIHRINFAGGGMGREEKSDRIWELPLPYVNDGRYSFGSRRAQNRPPVLSGEGGSSSRTDAGVCLEFPAGSDDDFVHSYKVVIDGDQTQYYFSDFYNGLDQMRKTVHLEIKKLNHPEREHTFDVYAVDSWGAESEQFIRIQLPAAE